jgi:hypothetical protein
MYFTLGQAAKEVGKSKGTLSNMIKSGALSVAEKTDKGYKIEAAELFRAFPNHNPTTVVNEQPKTPITTDLNTAKDRELELLRERLKDKDDVIEDLRKRLDREGEERRNLTRMITDMREESQKKSLERRKRFLGIIPYEND